MKTLIAYYSWSSNNELLALELQRRLNCDVVKIEDGGGRTKFTILLDRVFNRTPKIKYRPVCLEDYNHVILVSPVWMSGIATPLKAFILRERENINHYSFISICGGQPGQREKLMKELAGLVHQEADNVTELCITDLMGSQDKHAQSSVIDYKFRESDLSYFDSRIENFLRVVEPIPQ